MRGGRVLLLLPVLIFYGFLLVWPISDIISNAVGGGLASFHKLRDHPLTGLVIENTLFVSAVTTLIATVVAYFLAFLAWRTSGIRRMLIFAFVLLPFWTPVLVKNFAWIQLLQQHGVINTQLSNLHLIDEPLDLLYSRLAVTIGMVHYCLPYAVFPMYAAMIPLDRRLEDAAASLGAGAWRRARLVLFPLTLPGVLAGSLLVFIISVGFFITPVLLGGPGDWMVANLIEYYQRRIVDFETASLLALLVTAAVFVLVLMYQRIPREGQYGRV